MLKRALVSQDYRETDLFARNDFPITPPKYDEERGIDIRVSAVGNSPVHRMTKFKKKKCKGLIEKWKSYNRSSSISLNQTAPELKAFG